MINLETDPVHREWLNANYYLELYFEPTCISIEEAFQDIDDLDNLIANVNHGNLLYFDAIMIMGYLQDTGMEIHLTHDTLGECVYKSKEDFIQNSGYYNDMKNNCLIRCIDLVNEMKYNLPNIVMEA